MSLLDDKSFSLSLDGSRVIPMAAAVGETAYEGDQDSDRRPPSDLMTVDVQKFSSFSLRRKKERPPSHTKSQSRTPPGSPKATKFPETAPVGGGVGIGRRSSAVKGGGGNKGRKQYAVLMENEDSNGEEDDEDNFLLSKGHVAREKRSSSNPLFARQIVSEGMAQVPNQVGGESANESSQGFPVQFTPPKEARFPTLETESDVGDVFEFVKSPIAEASHVTRRDDHVTLPPPETGGHHIPIIPSPSIGFVMANEDLPSLPSLSLPPVLPPSLPQPTLPTSQPTLAEGTEEADWSVSDDMYYKCVHQFNGLKPVNGYLSGEKARDFFIKSKLPVDELSKIWKLSDADRDGQLTQEEFIIAMKLVLMRRKKFDIPQSLPEALVVKERSLPSVAIPPPIVKTTPTESVLETDSSTNQPPRPPPPAFLTSAHRAKTEPSIAVSGATPTPLEHVMVGDKPYTRVNLSVKSSKKPNEINTNLIDIDKLNSEETHDTVDLSELHPLTHPLTHPLEPAVARLVSVDTEESTGDEDETSALVTVAGGEMLGKDQVPIPKPRRKKRPANQKREQGGKPAHAVPMSGSDLIRSHTIHGRVNQPPPRPPAPYQGRSPQHIAAKAPPSEPKVSRESSPNADDVVPMVTRVGTSESDETFDKGHGRSTSWDMTKMLREGIIEVHADLPAAEPPKLPPRKNIVSPSSDDEGSKNTPTAPAVLQRSASTGSIASVGQPTSTLKSSSRSPSIDSGSLLMSTAPLLASTAPILGSTSTNDSFLPRTTTLSNDSNRRRAPAPPATKPKPVVPKKPIFPPSFKKVNTPPEKSSDTEDDRVPLSMETYKKKTKIELQNTVKQLKEENEMYNRMNKELRQKLQELIEQRHKLEVKLESMKKNT